MLVQALRSTFPVLPKKYLSLIFVALLALFAARVLNSAPPDEYATTRYRLHQDHATRQQAPGGVFRQNVDTNYPTSSNAYLPNKIKSKNAKKSYLHLIVPATSANENLCKMLLSITALGYPAPIFISWGDDARDDQYTEKAVKVGGILRYLRTLPKAREGDLVLIVDGFDSWFQLRPSVLIQRYFQVLNAEEERLNKRFGEELVHDYKILSSIIFAADKTSLPEDQGRAAYWAVPNSTLPPYAFGPDTDFGEYRQNYRPRWLNSGTIIGPIKDLKRLFKATLDRIQTSNATSMPAQLHFGDIYGRQEYARSLYSSSSPDIPFTNTTNVPVIDSQEESDFHITLDYEGLLFQLVSYSWKYLGWFAYDGSTKFGQLAVNSSEAQLNNALDKALRWSLAEDIARSQPPLDGINNRFLPETRGDDPSRDPQASGLFVPEKLSWSDVMLGTNTISGSAFALIHHNSPKDYLESWWNNMWFFKYGESILKNAQAAAMATTPFLITKDGTNWWNWVTDDNDDIVPEHRVGGGFDDKGSWHSWHRICSMHEDVIFHNKRALQ